MQDKEEKIEFKERENGLLWPYYQGKKAWSASSLISILKQIEYEDKKIPIFVLQKAAKNGKLFHEIIQNFIQSGSDLPNYSDLKISTKTGEKLKETIEFIKRNNQVINAKCFLGSERLHYTFYKGILLAAYVDLEFNNNYIVELKTNNGSMNESPLTLLAFQIQLLVQHLCSGKEVYLLWSTGNGVTFHKFSISNKLLKAFDILIDLLKKKDDYSLIEKRKIVENILGSYSPEKLIVL